MVSCTVFEDSLARVWPVGLAADPKRAERIHAFAKSNGWAATIHDTGVRVVFKKCGVISNCTTTPISGVVQTWRSSAFASLCPFE